MSIKKKNIISQKYRKLVHIKQKLENLKIENQEIKTKLIIQQKVKNGITLFFMDLKKKHTRNQNCWTKWQEK